MARGDHTVFSLYTCTVLKKKTCHIVTNNLFAHVNLTFNTIMCTKRDVSIFITLVCNFTQGWGQINSPHHTDWLTLGFQQWDLDGGFTISLHTGS